MENESIDTKKRNKNPDALQVLRLADLEHLETPEKKSEALMENRYEIVIHNLEYLMAQQGLRQAKLCKDLDNYPQAPQLTGYKNRGKDIPMHVIAKLAGYFGYTPEQFMGTLLDRQESSLGMQSFELPPRPKEELLKYVGRYHIRFFATEARVGANNRTTSQALAKGMLSVYPVDASEENIHLAAEAFLNATEEEEYHLENALKNAEYQGGVRGIRACYEKAANPDAQNNTRMKCYYRGTVSVTQTMTEINLKQISGTDVVHLTFHNCAATSSRGKDYKGGVATMMSTSRGFEHQPCVQAALLSRKEYTGIANEELAEYLQMTPPVVDASRETKAIYTYMKVLFPDGDPDSPLAQMDDEDRIFMLESFIEKKVTDLIKRNVVSYYKVSRDMDADFYKSVCK